MDLKPTHPDHVADATRHLLKAFHHWRYSIQPGGNVPSVVTMQDLHSSDQQTLC